jgi:hypothetical protein
MMISWDDLPDPVREATDKDRVSYIVHSRRTDPLLWLTVFFKDETKDRWMCTNKGWERRL